MDQAVSNSYLTQVMLALVVTTALYFVMNGAQIFERPSSYLPGPRRHLHGWECFRGHSMLIAMKTPTRR
jgi:hypothetical protein